MLLKAAFPRCILRGINGFVNLWMIRLSWDGEQTLIIRLDHVDLERGLSTLLRDACGGH